jgi:hypothetical protein
MIKVNNNQKVYNYKNYKNNKYKMIINYNNINNNLLIKISKLIL